MNLDDLVDSIELPEEFDGLPTFVVGGAVRDVARGVAPADIDLMVAEVSPDEMNERGFREIDSPNNDTFAVFQDSLGREVAIAREEESTGDSHTEFDIEPVEPDVRAKEAVERDLERRDIRYNSMSIDIRHGVLHDPFDGMQDIEDGVIRATNPKTFVEDPLRVLRVARFAARFDDDIDNETMELMEEAVDLL